MQSSIFLRDQVIFIIRKYFLDLSIIETMTSALTKYSGIEPFLDPPMVGYKDHERSSFFLRTSPEFSLKKHLCLFYKEAPGIYEIARAFRDEKSSPCHSPEFTMVEWYENNTNYSVLPQRIMEILNRIIISSTITLPIHNDVSNNKFQSYTVQQLFKLFLNIELTPHTSVEEYYSMAKRYNIGYQEISNVDSSQMAIYEEWQKIQYFNLIFDMVLLPKMQEGIWFVHQFPSFGRGMAHLNIEGWSERTECYINGLEIANGYQEMYNPIELEHLWVLNSQLRFLEGKTPHPQDPLLLELTPRMKDVTGLAFGLERMIMVLFGIQRIQEFIVD